MVYTALCNLVPDQCPGCGAATPHGFCPTCRALIGRIRAPCPRCALAHRGRECGLANADWHVDRVIAPFAYCEPLTAHIHALKFGRQRRIGDALGELLAREVSAGGGATGVDAVTAVPLHRARRIERGYNQANEIARSVAATLKLRLLTNGIERARATRPQAQLAAGDRATNLRGAFVVTRKLTAQHIAIVDDVMTTGATLNALAAVLEAHGVERIDAWAVARAV